MFNNKIEIHEDVCFSLLNIVNLFKCYGIWQGFENFRCKSGTLYPIKFLKKVEENKVAKCILFDLFYADNYNYKQYEPDEFIKKTVEEPKRYGKGQILLELSNLLDMRTQKQPTDLKIQKHNMYGINSKQYFGAIIVEDFIKCPCYIFQQNNGKHIIFSHDDIKQLNHDEKKILGISNL